MKVCQLCRQKQCTELLHCGHHPVCHRFVEGFEQEEKYPLVLGQCAACGLVQLTDPVPVENLVPRYEWIKYNEPEAHLGQLVEIITALPGITKDSTICGVSYKDDSTIERLRQSRFNHTWRINMANDLGISNERAGLETVLDCLRSEFVSELHRTFGVPDIVIARHILEHASDLVHFLQALCALVHPTGYIVVEVPDSRQALERTDVGVIWEEHISYFTPETLRNCFAVCGLKVLKFENFPYPQEDCLVVIGQQADVSPAFLDDQMLNSERSKAAAFVSNIVKLRSDLHLYLTNYRKQHGKIVIFGAGHRSCMYINLLKLEGLIDFVIDDDPHKQGLKMPGSRLLIRKSNALLTEDIKLCLLAINPESEDKIIANNEPYSDNGGCFASISPGSKHALKI